MMTGKGKGALLAVCGIAAVAIGLHLLLPTDNKPPEPGQPVKPDTTNIHPKVDGPLSPAPKPDSQKTETVAKMPPVYQPMDVVYKPGRPIDERLEAVGKLTETLTTEEVAKVKEVTFRLGEDESVRNECANLLFRQAVPPDLMDDLIASHKNPKESVKWRAYSSQFILYAFLKADENTRKRGIATLAETAMGEDSKLASTALLQLQRIAEETGDAEAKNLVKELAPRKAVSADPVQAGAAMNAAIKAGDASLLPLARKNVAGDCEIRLTLTSIGMLGQLGNADDLKILEGLKTHKDPRIVRVATYQSNQLQRRLKAGTSNE